MVPLAYREEPNLSYWGWGLSQGDPEQPGHPLPVQPPHFLSSLVAHCSLPHALATTESVSAFTPPSCPSASKDHPSPLCLGNFTMFVITYYKQVEVGLLWPPHQASTSMACGVPSQRHRSLLISCVKGNKCRKLFISEFLVSYQPVSEITYACLIHMEEMPYNGALLSASPYLHVQWQHVRGLQFYLWQ